MDLAWPMGMPRRGGHRYGTDGICDAKPGIVGSGVDLLGSVWRGQWDRRDSPRIGNAWFALVWNGQWEGNSVVCRSEVGCGTANGIGPALLGSHRQGKEWIFKLELSKKSSH